MADKVRHEVTSIDGDWTYGKIYNGSTFFGDWCRYTGSGNAPTPEQLAETERLRTEKAEQYRIDNPREPSKEYHEAIKKWPVK